MDNILIFRPTRIGLVGIREENGALAEIQLPCDGDRKKGSSDLGCGSCCAQPIMVNSDESITDKTFRELDEYLAGRRETFDIPISPRGTPFMLRVWKELCNVPYGSTLSYQEIAKRIGSPQSARAVGGAIHRNPIPILIPCHRIIGSDGSLTGYAPGLDLKRRLLDLEKNHVLR